MKPFPAIARKSQWLYLPDVVLIEIFSYLSDDDRARAAQVCSHWSEIFETPCLWRTRTLEMGGVNSLVSGAKAYKFAERFGQYLKFLTLSCSHPSTRTCKLFQKCFGTLLTLLTTKDTQLYEFEFCRLEVDRYWKFDTPREKLIGIFSKFLKNQKFLHSFDMSSSHFPTFGGCRILGSVSHQSGGLIRDLIIEDFFHSRLAVFQESKFLKVMGKFTNLEYLSLNYNCLSEEIIELFSKTLHKKLSYLTVKVARNDPHHHRISGYAWKQFSMACPELHVAFWFESIGHYFEIAGILVREIPVKEFHLWTGYSDAADWQLGRTIEHVVKCYSNSLVTVSLELDNIQEIVDTEILKLVTKGRRLRELTVNAIVGIDTVGEMLQLQRQQKIDLRMLHVTCCSLTDQGWLQLKALRDRYRHMINQRNLNYKITTDLLIEMDLD